MNFPFASTFLAIELFQKSAQSQRDVSFYMPRIHVVSIAWSITVAIEDDPSASYRASLSVLHFERLSFGKGGTLANLGMNAFLQERI